MRPSPCVPVLETLMRCAAVSAGADGALARLAGLETAPEQLFQASLRHEVFPLVYQNALKKMAPDHPAWKGTFYSNFLRNMRLSKKLVWVMRLLADHGIEMLALKGPVLAVQAYADLNLRSFTDLDILIHPRDFAAAYAVLGEAGAVPEAPLTPAQQKWLVISENHYAFRLQEDILEVHWGVAELGVLHPVMGDRFWQEVTETEILEQKVASLSVENALFLACLHGAKHGWQKLKYIADLAHLIHAHPGVNWLRFLRGAKASGFHRLVCLGLLLAENPGGVRLDSATRSEIQSDPQALALAGAVRGRLLRDDAPLSATGGIWFYLKARERFRDRAYYVFDQLFIPKQADWRVVSLPSARWYPLYALIRPIRLAVKFGLLAVLKGRR